MQYLIQASFHTDFQAAVSQKKVMRFWLPLWNQTHTWKRWTWEEIILDDQE